MKNKFAVSPIFFFIFVLSVFFAPLIIFRQTYFLRDLTFIFQPWKTLAAQFIQSGQLPLWNNYSACGMPLMANWQSAVFYPFSMLFYIFPFAAALKAFTLVQVFLAGFFAYLFAGKLKLSRWGAGGMMILFALNGYLISRMEFLSHFSTDIWIFALLLFVDSPALLSISLAFAFLAGHQMFFFLILILLLYGISDFNLGVIKPKISNIFLAGSLAAGMCAIQLIPTAELVGLSQRIQSGVDASVAMLHSLKSKDLFGLVLPQFFSKASLLTGEKYFWAKSFYVGIVCFAFITIRMFSQYLNNIRIFALVLFFTGIIFSLGNSIFIYPMFYKYFPFIKLLRYPAQWMILSVTGITLLLGETMRNFRKGALITVLIGAELVFLSWNFQDKVNDNYFDEKPASVAFLQENSNGNRFILSPGTETDRRIRISEIAEIWQKARANLYGLVCLPYRISNAYGMGEPLLPYRTDFFVNEAYKQKTPQEALPYYKKLGVKYLICKKKLSDPRGYAEVFSGQVYIYKIKEKTAIFYSDDPELAVDLVYSVNNQTFFVSESKKTSEITWRENFFPGWQIFINKNSMPVSVTEEGFRKFSVPEGKNKVFQIYDPLSFRIGMLLSVLCIFFLSIYAIIKLRKYRPSIEK